MLKDILGQAWEAMMYNRRRTAITMIGWRGGSRRWCCCWPMELDSAAPLRRFSRSGAPTLSGFSRAGPASRREGRSRA